MCGIAGILRVHPPGASPLPPELSIPESWLDILDESIKHRGPDGHGRFRDRATRPDGSTVDVALVHRRLSIIDLSDGHQPMVSPSRSGGARRASEGLAGTPDSDLVAVVFNGCIYNHRDLRRELTAAGHRFITDHSDTEVLIHGWRQWRQGLLGKLDGMFAAAIWDRALAMLVIARDVSGEKPLYFARPTLEAGEALLFSSTPLGVLRVVERIAPDPGPAWKAGIERRIAALQAAGADPTRPVELIDAGPHPALGVPSTHVDLRHAELRHWQSMLRRPPPHPRGIRLGSWLTRGWGGDNSPFQWVFEARPARYHTSHNEGPLESNTAYWEPRSSETGGPRQLTPELTDQLLRASVERRLDADVPLGCFLSGGVDSGLIAAHAQASLVARGSRLRTFTVRMPNPGFDESEAAAETADHLGTEHRTLECSPRAADDLIHIIRQLGLPFGDSSLLPTYWLCRAAREHVKVALAGDGGDELFGGYLRYLVTPVMARHGRLLRHIPGGLIPHSGPKSRRERLRRLILACRYGGYEDLLRIFDATDEYRLTGTQPRRQSDSLPGVDDPLLAGPISDYHNYLPYDLLRKTDTASMAVALEVRAPFLDPEIIRCAFRTPIEVRMPNGELKGLLRQVARRHLPARIVNRPKQGFAIPIGDWFRTDYGGMKTLLLDHLNSAEPWGSPTLGIDLNMKFVRQMLDEHMNQKRDHSQRLYMLLVLSIWAKSLSEPLVSSNAVDALPNGRASRL